MDLIDRLPGLGNELAKKTVKDQISDKLAYMICSGLLQPGDELPSERELAATLDVSRETVRGAMQTLAALRMIEVSQGSRSKVAPNRGYELYDAVSSLRRLKEYTPDTVNEARRVVEVAVVRDAAGRIGDKDLNRLEAMLRAQSAMFDDPVRFQISDREFHSAVYDASSNPLLATYVHDLYAYALGTRRTAMRQAGSVRQGYEDHVAILAALKTRDPDSAALAVENHLENFRKSAHAAIGDGVRRIYV